MSPGVVRGIKVSGGEFVEPALQGGVECIRFLVGVND